MHIWELRFDGINQYAVLVPCGDEDEDLLEIFTAEGKDKHWAQPPKIEVFIDQRKKIAKPRADISYLIAGAIILNENAHQALKDFLLPFGQLLEVDCNGKTEYFYNVTRLISCIDYASSDKKGKSVVKEVFLPGMLPDAPDTPLIFKDPYTARTRIYLNQAGKEKFEQLANAAGLFGARFVEAGQGLF